MAKTIKDLHSALANVVTSMAGKNNDITYSKTNFLSDTIPQVPVVMPNTSTSLRRFKAKLGIAQWWITGSGNRYYSRSVAQMKEDIDRFSSMGIEEMTLCIHMGRDKSTGEWYMIHSKEDMLTAYNYAATKGIRCNVLKFMVYDSTARSNMKTDWTNCKAALTSNITSYCSYFKDNGCEFDCVIVLNEMPGLYIGSSYTDDIKSLLAIPKTYGYNASMSLTNPLEFYQMTSTLRDAMDTYCINIYPNLSYIGNRTSLEDATRGWDRFVHDLRGIKQRYPGKAIIVTETGCQDRWEALSCPGKFNWTTDYPNTSLGDAPALFLQGMFESGIDEVVKSVNWWFYDSLYDNTGTIYPQVEKVIKMYIKGVY